MNYEPVLAKFKIKTRQGAKIQAFCPAHEDKNASLSILLTQDKILLYCHAGCSVPEILKPLNLSLSDLFEPKPEAIYQYRNADGSFHHEKLKYVTPKGKRFTQRRIDGEDIVDNLGDIPKIPYNYPEMLDTIKKSGLLVYVEGEKDADTAKVLGYTATTMGGASDWKPEFANFFRKSNVVIIPDKDDAGLKLAKKMITDLKPVAKSLKVIVLPDGKDLTEWVQAGNDNLNELIEQAQLEYSEPLGIPEPTLSFIAGGYKLTWQGLNLVITIDRIVNDTDSEIAIYDNDNLIYISGFKLLSISHKTELSRSLSKQKKIDWDKIINQVTTRVLAELRKGEPVIMLTEEYGKTRPEYLLEPLFIKNAPNVIYADQSSAKSLFMTLINIVLTLGGDSFSQTLNLDVHSEHKVLFLDWENDANITGWTKQCLLRGMGIVFDVPIAYLHCGQPLHKLVNHIRDKIAEVKADVVIIDSLGMAVGADLNATEPAFAFFSALRQLPVTPLIIAHTAKDLNNKRKTVYGNAYYSNESRSIWEINKDQQPADNFLTITLFNRKPSPFTRLHNPLAYKFTFEDDTTYVEQTDPIIDKRETGTPEEPPSATDVILAILSDATKPLSPREITELTNPKLEDNVVRTALYRLKTRKKDPIYVNDAGKYSVTPSVTPRLK